MRYSILIAVTLLIVSRHSLSVAFDIESNFGKYIVLKNPYLKNSSYIFSYLRVNAKSQLLDSLNRNFNYVLMDDETIDIYVDGELIVTFDKYQSRRLLSISQQGWKQSINPACVTVMLFVVHGVLSFSESLAPIGLNASSLSDAIAQEEIAPGEVVIINSENKYGKHSSGFVYLGNGYFISCENGAKSFYFRRFNHIDSEQEELGFNRRISKVNSSSDLAVIGMLSSSKNLTEDMLRFQAEYMKISTSALPSYIK